jgi:hypothetical protein
MRNQADSDSRKRVNFWVSRVQATLTVNRATLLRCESRKGGGECVSWNVNCSAHRLDLHKEEASKRWLINPLLAEAMASQFLRHSS